MRKQPQLSFEGTANGEEWHQASTDDVLEAVRVLRHMHEVGLLGGETMPEDANPQLPPQSSDNYHYFSLPMALNYQRDSYVLWRSARATYLDEKTRFVFTPTLALAADEDEVRSALLKHGLALQPNRHILTWLTICRTLIELLDGEIIHLFERFDRDVQLIKDYVQTKHHSGFPYLSGPKICNYWLYVISNYTESALQNREALTVAPDTHVIQATIRLGLVAPTVRDAPDARSIIAARWSEVLEGTGIAPIDIHTPLWLWSRRGFVPLSNGPQ